MVGGQIIENAPHALAGENDTSIAVQRIWCVDRHGDECAVYAEPAAAVLEAGEQVWWQSGKVMARGDTVTFRKVGYSFAPHFPRPPGAPE